MERPNYYSIIHPLRADGLLFPLTSGKTYFSIRRAAYLLIHHSKAFRCHCQRAASYGMLKLLHHSKTFRCQCLRASSYCMLKLLLQLLLVLNMVTDASRILQSTLKLSFRIIFNTSFRETGRFLLNIFQFIYFVKVKLSDIGTRHRVCTK